MFGVIKKAVEKGKTSLIVFLFGTLTGAGLALWLMKRRESSTSLSGSPRPRSLPKYTPSSVSQPERPVRSAQVVDVPVTPPSYDIPNLDNEVDDINVEFDDGEF